MGAQTGLDLVAMIRDIVRHELRQDARPSVGIITAVHHRGAVDNGNHDCDVRCRDRDLTWYKVPVASQHCGRVEALYVDDLVLLDFVDGDWQRPVVVGRLFSDQLRAPEHGEGQCLQLFPPRAEENARIEVLADPENSRSYQIRVPPDISLQISEAGCELVCGDCRVQLDAEGKQIIADSGSATVTMADDGSIAMEAQGDITISSQGQVSIEGQGGVAIDSAGSVDVTGATVNLN